MRSSRSSRESFNQEEGADLLVGGVPPPPSHVSVGVSEEKGKRKARFVLGPAQRRHPHFGRPEGGRKRYGGFVAESIRKRQRKPSHLLEDITLGPVSRWKKYRRVPARFITQVVLLGLLVWHVVEVTRTQNGFNRVWLRNFVQTVYPGGYSAEARRKASHHVFLF